MDRIYHYTSNYCWEYIKREGVLRPLSDPLQTPTEVSNRIKDLARNKRYLVGLKEPECSGWTKYGLIELLFERTTKEVLLSVPITNTKGFVRDHMYLSPKFTLDKYGIDILHELREKKIHRNDNRFLKCARDYFESTTPLKKYSGNFEVPEIWLSQTTPLEKIDLVI